MNLLMDTHALLWMALESPRLTPRSIQALKEAQTVHWSIVNLWEIGIKMSGQGYSDLKLPPTWEITLPSACSRSSILELPIAPLHCRRLQDLPFHHKDPFDRMLVAQALEENLTILSCDRAFDAYGVKRIW